MTPDIQGTVFNIQKFSLHDGPGIRTTVFFKGCPLSCQWCSNPESQNPRPQLAFKAEACSHCLQCVSVCPETVHIKREHKHHVQFDRCRQHGHCIQHCPAGALRMIGGHQSVQDLLDEVMKDKVYFEKSGGGLTLSGGEPLAQFAFAKTLLQQSKERGLNTAVETSGYVSPKQIQTLLPWVDTWLYDYKLRDDALHQEYTGVSNQMILENLQYLIDNNAHLILRCPVIPGINDTDHHFQGITQISRANAVQQVEIMAYHDMGRGKAIEAGMVYPLSVKTVTEARAKSWLDRLKAMGCEKAKKG